MRLLDSELSRACCIIPPELASGARRDFALVRECSDRQRMSRCKPPGQARWRLMQQAAKRTERTEISRTIAKKMFAVPLRGDRSENGRSVLDPSHKKRPDKTPARATPEDPSHDAPRSIRTCRHQLPGVVFYSASVHRHRRNSVRLRRSTGRPASRRVFRLSHSGR